MLACNVALFVSGGVAMIVHGVKLQSLHGALDYSLHRTAVATFRNQSCLSDLLRNLFGGALGNVGKPDAASAQASGACP